MASRDLTVRIDADSSGFDKGVKSARQSASVFERELAKIEARQTASVAHATQLRARYERQAAQDAARSARAAEQQAARQQQAMAHLGIAGVAMGTAVAVGVGKAVSANMEFERSLSSLRAATGANAATMGLLRDAALQTGKDTAFSASEAAGAQVALAKAGVLVRDVLGGGLAGAVALAAAGQLDIAEASETAASAMTQFKLQGRDVPHIADLLAAAAGKAQGEVHDMGLALRQSGGIASQMGLSVEDTIGALAQFASAGYTGSDAGTSFKQMLLSLVPSSDDAAESMKKYGLEFFDAQGKVKSFSGIAESLRVGLGDLSKEQQTATLKTIFGADAFRVAAVAMDGGAKSAELWRKNVDDAGYASRTAATMTDNLAGDVERLGGSITSALLENGSAANGVLRGFVQAADAGVGAFSALPGAMQGTATGVTILGGAASAAGGAFLLAVPKIAEFRDALEHMGPRTQAWGRRLGSVASVLGGPWGLALAAGIVGLGAWGHQQAEAADRVAEHAKALDTQTGALTDYNAAIAVQALEQKGLLKAADDLGISVDLVTRAALGQGDALKHLRGIVSGYTDTAREAGRVWTGSVTAVDDGSVAALKHAGAAEDLLNIVEEQNRAVATSREKWTRTNTALGVAKEVTEEATAAQSGLTGALQQTDEQAQTALRALEKLAEVTASFIDPAEAYSAAQQAAEEVIRESAERSVQVQNDAVDKKIRAVQREYDARLEAARNTKGITADAIHAIEDQRDATVDGLGKQKKSWEDFSGAVKVSVAAYLAELKKQVEAQQGWESNMLTLAGRVSAGTLAELQAMGPKGAPLVAQLATASAAELGKLEPLFAAKSKTAADAFAKTLTDAGPVLTYIAGTAGRNAAAKLGAELAAGHTTIDQIMRAYGISITNGVVAPLQIAEDTARRLGELFPALNSFDVSDGVPTASAVTGSRVPGPTSTPSPALSGARVPAPPSVRLDPAAQGGAGGMAGRGGIGSLTIHTQTGATAQEIAEEVSWQARLGSTP